MRSGDVHEGTLWASHPHRASEHSARNENVVVYYLLPHGRTSETVYVGAALCAHRSASLGVPSAHFGLSMRVRSVEVIP